MNGTHTTAPARFATALIVAGGRGRRCGGPLPKQFAVVAGRPLLAWTLEAFHQAGSIDSIVVVVPAEARDRFTASVLPACSSEKIKAVVSGGAERFDSVAAGLEQLPPRCSIVAVHDGVRPFVSAGLIDRLTARAAAGVCIVPGCPPSSTIKRVRPDDTVIETVDRATLMEIQTPQVFPREVLVQAYRRSPAEKAGSWTDDAQVVEAAGWPVLVAPGERRNIKITVSDDLELAAFWLESVTRP